MFLFANSSLRAPLCSSSKSSLPLSELFILESLELYDQKWRWLIMRNISEIQEVQLFTCRWVSLSSAPKVLVFLCRSLGAWRYIRKFNHIVSYCNRFFKSICDKEENRRKGRFLYRKVHCVIYYRNGMVAWTFCRTPSMKNNNRWYRDTNNEMNPDLKGYINHENSELLGIICREHFFFFFFKFGA